ncbi:MAG: helix-turn-helix domain-containing protein [Propionibacteriaceae bacterium]|nr:helix-turn-helix domain-containing protein [Propionibacteriaceae bacterium]
MTRPPSSAFNTLARAAKGEVWTPQIVRALRRLLSTDILLTDTKGSVLAAAPSHSSIDPMRILAATTNQDPAFATTPVQVASETVAVLGCAADQVAEELLEFAANLIAADLLAHLKVLKAKDVEAAAAFHEALRATHPDHDLADRLRNAGLAVDHPFRILAGTVNTNEARLATIAWNLHALLAQDSTVPSRMTIDGTLVTLVPDSAAVPQRARRLWEQLRRLDPDAAVGISQSHTGVSGLRIAHSEAARATTHGPGVHQAETIDVITATLLSQATPEATAAAINYLAPLTTYDQTHSGHLIETLQAWLDNDRSVPATSQALYIHRNTLRYRLRQAEELLGQPLNTTAVITNLTLALQIADRRTPPSRS